MKVWKRNAVVAAIVVFVCAAVYFNWSYHNDYAESVDGKLLGQAELVSGTQEDTLVEGTETEGAQEGESAESQSTSSSSYFASARLNRQQARDSALSLYQQSVEGENVDEETKTQATMAMQSMANYTISEAQIENMVIAKGFADCVAFINENSISVVVSTLEEGLSDSDVAKITEIVNEQTGFSANQIKIIEVS